MRNTKIKFSVIIPTFNREHLLTDALKSAYDALPIDGEIIVVNDGLKFSDEIISIIVECGASFTTTSGSAGAGAARNLGAEMARGSWLLFLDDDDLISKDYWRAVKAYVDLNLKVEDDAYGFCASVSYSNRTAMRTAAHVDLKFTFNLNDGTNLKPKLAGFGLGFWVSKSLFERIGGINPELQTNEDLDFCLKLLNAGAQCYQTKDIGAFIFTGNHGNTLARSTTKRHSPKQRAAYFKHIIDYNSHIIKSDPKTNRWLWKRFLKMEARCRGLRGLQLLWATQSLTTPNKGALSIYWGSEFLISLFRNYKY
tara:strand:+ start:306 stop:1235 length:930 start_codon:yes stop_codon:yes gene_type:complete